MKRFHASAGLVACALSALLATPLAAERYPDRRAVRTPVVTGGAATDAATRKTVVDLLLQIDRLQQQVRKLRNQVEILNHEVARLKKQQRTLIADIDRRVSTLERGRGPTGDDKAAGKAAGKSAASKRPPARSSAEEHKMYDAAFNLMRRGYYTRAAKAFRKFIGQYPESALAGNAQYWLGEANYHVRNFKKAVVEFNKVVSNYPQSSKVSDALLKIGYSYYEMGDWKRSRQALKQVLRRYPNTTNAKSAQIRLNRIKREGH